MGTEGLERGVKFALIRNMDRSRNSSSSSLILDGIMDSYKSLLIGLPHKTARGKGIGLSAFGIREETGLG